MKIASCCLVFTALLISWQCAAEIYKYKDEKGKWQFTDKPPKRSDAEVVAYKSAEKKSLAPDFIPEQVRELYQLRVVNPFHAPLTVTIKSEQLPKGRRQWVVKPKGQLVVLKQEEAILPFTYRWQLGDAKATPASDTYSFPFQSKSCVHVSQGFNGRFSHQREHSRYAVDIALPVGTNIVAARDGVVVGVKDDYHMGGVNEYFLDKGNYVTIFHSDGTFASYYHILLGTAAVKPGDQVSTGQLLARSGSSGFSSGPHLHFVVTRNGGFKQVSLPFQFRSESGNGIHPVEGLKICDQRIEH